MVTTLSRIGIYNCGWYGGSIPAAAITYGTLNIPNAYSWRIPLILQAFACFIVLIGVFFIPESPRFLMANGRDEEAVEFLVKYHGGGDPNSTLVALEVAEFRAAIAVNGVDKRWWDCEFFLSSLDRVLTDLISIRPTFVCHPRRTLEDDPSRSHLRFWTVFRQWIGLLQHRSLQPPRRQDRLEATRL